MSISTHRIGHMHTRTYAFIAAWAWLEEEEENYICSNQLGKLDVQLIT